MKSVLITGNRDKDLCGALVPLLEQRGFKCECLSRSNGFDFEKDDGVISKIIKKADNFDIFINMHANHFYKASVLTQKLYVRWFESGHSARQIVTVGSTTDRVKGAKSKLYHYEKRALRDLSSGLALIGVWDNGPRLTHISIGTLENRSENNPGRRCLTLKETAEYFVWLLTQPEHLNINEISIDPIQLK